MYTANDFTIQTEILSRVVLSVRHLLIHFQSFQQSLDKKTAKERLKENRRYKMRI